VAITAEIICLIELLGEGARARAAPKFLAYDPFHLSAFGDILHG